MKHAAIPILLGLALLAPAPVAASHGFDISGDYIVAGIDVGLTVDDDLGALLGLEISYVDLDREGGWAGLVLAMAWLSDIDASRLTLGAEVGYGLFGVEGGFNVDTAGTIGGRARAVGTVGAAAIYAGISFGGGVRGEFGILLKAPLEL